MLFAEARCLPQLQCTHLKCHVPQIQCALEQIQLFLCQAEFSIKEQLSHSLFDATTFYLVCAISSDPFDVASHLNKLEIDGTLGELLQTFYNTKCGCLDLFKASVSLGCECWRLDGNSWSIFMCKASKIVLLALRVISLTVSGSTHIVHALPCIVPKLAAFFQFMK